MLKGRVSLPKAAPDLRLFWASFLEARGERRKERKKGRKKKKKEERQERKEKKR